MIGRKKRESVFQYPELRTDPVAVQSLLQGQVSQKMAVKKSGMPGIRATPLEEPRRLAFTPSYARPVWTIIPGTELEPESQRQVGRLAGKWPEQPQLTDEESRPDDVEPFDWSEVLESAVKRYEVLEKHMERTGQWHIRVNETLDHQEMKLSSYRFFGRAKGIEGKVKRIMARIESCRRKIVPIARLDPRVVSSYKRGIELEIRKINSQIEELFLTHKCESEWQVYIREFSRDHLFPLLVATGPKPILPLAYKEDMESTLGLDPEEEEELRKGLDAILEEQVPQTIGSEDDDSEEEPEEWSE